MQLFHRNPFKKTLLKCYSLTKTTEITHDLDLNLLNDKIKTLLSTDNQILKQVSSYYFKRGKHMRPLLVLLVAQATAKSTKYEKFNINQRLNDIENPIEFDQFPIENNILESQKRLSEITEMIHTASLLHDDVIDNAKTRRNDQSANEKYGNKMAVLAGDFLLSRACVALSRLRNLQVVELLSTVISNLVEGEFMQLRNSVSMVKVTDYTLGIRVLTRFTKQIY
jgi:hexaprenyl-diphosphate synthase